MSPGDGRRDNDGGGASLRDVQAQLHAVLRREAPATTLAEAWHASPERIAIYAHFVASHVRTVLDKNFPCLAHLLADQWPAMAMAYTQAHAPTHYELNESGRAFPEFLRANAAQHRLCEAHLELAEMEWLDWDVYRSKVSDLPARALPARLDNDATLALAVNPTMIIVEATYDAHVTMAQFAATRTCALRLDAGAAVPVALYRHPRSFASEVRTLDQVDLFALAIAERRQPLALAAAQASLAHDTAHEILSEAVARGIVSVVSGVAAPHDANAAAQLSG